MSMDGARKARRSAAATASGIKNARTRKCPRCLRLAALSTPVVWPGVGRARKCNYCGHEVGIIYGETFGYGVTPEPGVREVARDA
jgi:hypothetical protein